MLKEMRLMGVLATFVLLVTGLNSVTAATVASWPAEWAENQQGANNWAYLHYNTGSGGVYSLPWSSEASWYGWPTGLYISPGGTLPSSDCLNWTVLRWQSEVSGTIRIQGSVTRIGGWPDGADGAIAYINVNGVTKWSYDYASLNQTPQAFNITVSGVALGDSVDFVINPKANNWGDVCTWETNITSVPAPVFSPAGPNIDGPTPISISAVAGTTIYYTTDGSDPVPHGLQYSGPITVTNGTHLRAVAVGTDTSAETSQTYIYRVASWPAEWVENQQGANNWSYLYRTSTDETSVYSLPWSSEVSWYGWPSDLYISPGGCVPDASGTLWPVLRWQSEVSGTIRIQGSVTRIGGWPDGADGAIAYIRVNGVTKWSYDYASLNQTPQAFDITVPGVALGDSVDFVINPKANNWGDVCTWETNITSVPVPVFSPAGPNIDGPTPISITAVAGATIYYTTDGSDPVTHGLQYSGPITVRNGTHLRAVVGGMDTGAETSQTYIYRVASWPAEWAENQQGANNWAYLHYNTGSGGVYSLPWSSEASWYGWPTGLYISPGGTLPSPDCTNWTVLRWASEVSGTIQITGSVTRIGGWSDGTDGAIAYIAVNGVPQWSYDYTSFDQTPHTFDITVSGVALGDSVDFVINPKANNWSDVCTWETEITSVPAPVFSPAGPYIDGSTPISISAVAGTAIYYTRDGSTPTAGSLPYTGPVTVNAGDVLKAIAVTANNSWAVTSQTYVGPEAKCKVIGSVSLTDENIFVGILSAGNTYLANHILRGVMKFPLSGYTASVDTAMLYAEVIQNRVEAGQSNNYFVVEHYTDSRFPLVHSDASTTSVERVSGVETAAGSYCYAWNVKSYLQQDLAAGRTYSAFRIVQTDAGGNYLTDSRSFIVFNPDATLVVSNNPAPVGLSRGHRILLNRGLQIQTWAFPSSAGYFTEANWNLSNFTTLTPHTSGSTYDTYGDMSLLPSAPGIPWARVVRYPATDLSTNEIPYLSNLISIQLDDEVALTSDYIADIAARMANLKVKYPDVIVHTNQSKDQATETTVAQFQSYMQTAQPDILMFDNYAFNGSLMGGSPKTLYENMQKYRLRGLAGNDGTGTHPIPYALFTQTYTGEGLTHVASESEIRLNEFSAWAFGYKEVSAFLYYINDDDPARQLHSILFSDSGDRTPTDQFYQVAEANRQSRNLGPALVRLISTDVRMIMGQHKNFLDITVPNESPAGITTGLSGANPYITGISASNPGSKNDSKRGDVIVGFFKPLHESFDGDTYTNEKYFMITNGLSDGNGSAADTRQNIHITFTLPSTITSLQRLSRSTGQVEVVPLVSEGNGVYSLDLELEGGTGDLFKFNTGAPFVGFYQPSDLAVSPVSRPVGDQAGNTTFGVSNAGGGNMAWSAQVTDGGGWLQITGGSGTNAGTITAIFTANTGAQRTGTIHIDAGSAGAADVTVVQAAGQVLSPTVHGTVTYIDYSGFPLTAATIEVRNGTTVVETHSALTLSGSAGSKTYTFTTSLTGGPYTLAMVKNVQTGWKESTQANVTITADTTVNFTVTHALAGDASMDNKVDVSDLGILAANYGGTGKTWAQGDFSGDGKVDVSDLGILAAHYGQGSGGATQASDLPQDMKALGFSVDSNIGEPSDTQKTQPEENPVAKNLGGCGSAGLPLIAGLFLMGLLLVKIKE